MIVRSIAPGNLGLLIIFYIRSTVNYQRESRGMPVLHPDTVALIARIRQAVPPEQALAELLSNCDAALDRQQWRGQQTLNGVELHVSGGRLAVQDCGCGMDLTALHQLVSRPNKWGQILLSDPAAPDNHFHNLGFPTAFALADWVEVYSRGDGELEQAVLASDGVSGADLTSGPVGPVPGFERISLGRGTVVVLQLRPGCEGFLEPAMLQRAVAMHRTGRPGAHSVRLWADSDAAEPCWVEGRTLEPIWRREPAEVSPEEYLEYYRATFEAEAHDGWSPETDLEYSPSLRRKAAWLLRLGDQLTVSGRMCSRVWSHFVMPWLVTHPSKPSSTKHIAVNGQIELYILLFCPASRPRSLTKGLRLYLDCKFHSDTADLEMLPYHLSFIQGVVDSADLDLQDLQSGSKICKVVKRQLARRSILMLLALAEDHQAHVQLWRNFGDLITYGVTHDSSNRTKLARLMLFESSIQGKLSSLEQYLARMPDHQQHIWCSDPPGCSGQDSEFEVLYMAGEAQWEAMRALKEFDQASIVGIGGHGGLQPAPARGEDGLKGWEAGLARIIAAQQSRVPGLAPNEPPAQ